MIEKLLQDAAPILEFWESLPGIAQAGVIIIMAVVCAKLSAWILTSIVSRWTNKTKTTVDDELIALMHRPAFLVVLFLGLAMAAKKAGIPEEVLNVTISILETIGILVLVGFTIRASRLLLDALARKRDKFPLIQTRTLPLFYNASLLIVIGAGIYFLFLAWKIDPTAWLASAGIIGLALSFAAKDSLANLFAGAFIIADTPYQLGDFVILGSGERGKVTQIGLRSTRLLTRDDVEITVPNAVMGNSKIINESGGPYEKERIRVPIGVAYGSDIDQVEQILLSIAQAQEEILETPEPRVRLRAFGDWSVNFELLCWIKEPVLRGRLRHLLCKEIYKTFMAEGIEIPYPKRDVYLQNNSEQNARGQS
ncbi:MAG: mechanosensitive ion channel family protein [Planctomycetota bacterium]|nr:mechanosensitive ion channel family protein [Planctomycetota bacterium]